MNLYHFLLKFNMYVSRAEIRRSVLDGHVSINNIRVKYEDLESPITAKVGDIVKIGRKEMVVEAEHLPVTD